jgi:hypothetical protein
MKPCHLTQLVHIRDFVLKPMIPLRRRFPLIFAHYIFKICFTFVSPNNSYDEIDQDHTLSEDLINYLLFKSLGIA